MFGTTPKMAAKNHFADIVGINLEYALETYDWVGFCPLTDDGITVTGFWDKGDKDNGCQRSETRNQNKDI